MANDYRVLFTPASGTGSEIERFLPEYAELENSMKEKDVKYLLKHHEGLLKNVNALKYFIKNFYSHKFQNSNFIFDPYIHVPVEFDGENSFCIQQKKINMYTSTNDREVNDIERNNIENHASMLYCPYHAMYLSNNGINVQYEYDRNNNAKEFSTNLISSLESNELSDWARLSTNDITRLKSILKTFKINLGIDKTHIYSANMPLTELSRIALNISN